jgi:hypothetical protein
MTTTDNENALVTTSSPQAYNGIRLGAHTHTNNTTTLNTTYNKTHMYHHHHHTCNKPPQPTRSPAIPALRISRLLHYVQAAFRETSLQRRYTSRLRRARPHRQLGRVGRLCSLGRRRLARLGPCSGPLARVAAQQLDEVAPHGSRRWRSGSSEHSSSAAVLAVVCVWVLASPLPLLPAGPAGCCATFPPPHSDSVTRTRWGDGARDIVLL